MGSCCCTCGRGLEVCPESACIVEDRLAGHDAVGAEAGVEIDGNGAGAGLVAEGERRGKNGEKTGDEERTNNAGNRVVVRGHGFS